MEEIEMNKHKPKLLINVILVFYTFTYLFTSISCSRFDETIKKETEVEQESKAEPSTEQKVSESTAKMQSEPIPEPTPKTPTIKPDRINVTFYGSTKNSRAFTWYTKKNSSSVVQLTDINAKDFSKAENYSGVTTSLKIGNTVKYIHRVIVSGLKSGVKYYYRLGDESKNIRSDVGSFTTSSDNEKTFSFIHITDSQGGYSQTANVLKHAFSSYPETEFIAHTGDVVDHSYWDEKEWSDFFNLCYPYFKNTTIAPAPGNHDYNIKYKNTNMFNEHFTLNVPKGSDTKMGSYYSFDYENAHFTVLNTNEWLISKKQKKWLIHDLSASKSKWRIVLMHKGIYTNGMHSKNKEILDLRKKLGPIFDSYGVDLVLQGHDHTYLRTEKIRAGKPVSANSKGVVYITARSSGVKFYNIKKVSGVYPAYTIAGTKPMFGRVVVENNSLTYNAYEINKNNKKLVDKVTLKK